MSSQCPWLNPFFIRAILPTHTAICGMVYSPFSWVSIASSSGQYFQRMTIVGTVGQWVMFQSLLHQGNTYNGRNWSRPRAPSPVLFQSLLHQGNTSNPG